jgi:hypothetical protein
MLYGINLILGPFHLKPMPGDTASSKKPKRGGQRARRGRQGHPQTSQSSANATATDSELGKAQPVEQETKADEADEKICHICAESMEKKSYAVAECNHRTCHACALRLRALYKKSECTFCKVRCPSNNDKQCLTHM